MFKFVIKLNRIRPEISRTVYVPQNFKFSDLDDVLRCVFGLSHFHLSVFTFPGLNTYLWDFDKTYPDVRALDMNDIPIMDYMGLFRKFSWTYDLNKSYVFTVNLRKADKKFNTDYPFVESFKCEYNPIEDCHPIDFEEMYYCTLNNIEFPDYLPDFEMEKFSLDEVNDKLRK